MAGYLSIKTQKQLKLRKLNLTPLQQIQSKTRKQKYLK